MNICESVKASAVGCLSYIKCRITECFDKPARRPEIHITSGMRRPGPNNVPLSKLKSMMESDELEISHIIGELQRLAQSPLTLEKDVIYISGYLDPQLGLIGTDLKRNLAPYVKNTLSIRKMHFAGATFRRSTLERCALRVIRDINQIYKDSINDKIDLNLVGHSMGARIAEIVAQLLAAHPDLADKKIVFHKIISLNGANKGSPVAGMSKVICCFDENIAKDLRPAAIFDADKGFRDLDIESMYIAVKNDRIIPPDYAAPPACPVVVLRDVSMLSPHTAVLNDTRAKYLLLKQLAQ